MDNVLNIGIIGTGRIAHRFVPEVRSVNNIEITAVCNPHMESAKLFAEEFSIPYYCGQIEELYEHVEAVYIAVPHHMHYDYARNMLMHGIHVLCEKPMVFTRQQAEELFAIAAEHHCILMEGIKTAYCPGFQALIQTVSEGRIGKVRDVEACFSRLTPTNVREMTDEEYGGSFTEFGTYTLLPIMKLLGTEEKVIGFKTITGVKGIDIYTKTSLQYDRAMGLAKTGLSAKSEGQLIIAGSKGYIVAQAPWWLTRHFEIRYEDPNKRDIFDFPYEGQGLRYEIKAFLEKIRGERSINDGVSSSESIWLAEKMEQFLCQRRNNPVSSENKRKEKSKVRIFAHRGCSMAYPENTLNAFRAAAEIPGIAGVELDVQLTKDKEIVVIHDETVDRTTSGTGRVCDYTLEELKRLAIAGVSGTISEIPTLSEVFDCLVEICKKERKEGKFLINIELKNSVIRYEGMEERVLALVFEYGLQDNIIFSSFLPESMGLIKQFYPNAKTAILGNSLQKCLEEAVRMNADAVHPWIGGLDLEPEELKKLETMPVRAWNGEEPFFGQNRVLREKHLEKYADFGVTDVFTNVPEMYLQEK